MLKFLRKIRQNLLSEGNTGKYFTYAIGEIALVVLGILIALQINNWNENSNRNIKEQEILINLKQDFEYNQKEIAKVIKDNEATMDSALILLNNTGSKYTEGFNINHLIGDVSGTIYFYPKNGFLNDLINSGNLGIIKNSQLRNRLSSWLPILEDLNLRERNAKEFENMIIEYIIKNGSWLTVDLFEDDQTVKNINFPPSGFDVNNNNLLQKLEFENLIENQVVFIELVNERLELCLNLNNEILGLLDSEIKQ